MLAAYATIFGVAVALTLLALALMYRAAPHLGLVDHPAGRKVHAGAIPLIGGLGIFAGTGLTVIAGAVLNLSLSQALKGLQGHVGFLLGLAVLATLGAIDDVKPVPARYKLVIQTACCLSAVVLDHTVIGGVGFRIGSTAMFFGPVFLVPFTVIVLLTIINGVNMIDGIDGLAAGITAIGVVLMTKAVIAAHFVVDAFYLCAFLGSISAFLLVNYPLWPKRRAKIFLGDSGSLLLGFSLAYLAVKLSTLPERVIKPSTALWFFLIPVADAVWMYIRRTAASRRPFMPGRDHIHHQLMKYLPGFAVTWLLTGLTGLMACGAYLAERLGVSSIAIVCAWIFVFLLYGWLTHRPWKYAWIKSRRAEKRRRGGA